MSVVVTYHPKRCELAPLLDQLLAQTNRVVIVDNTPGDENRDLEDVVEESLHPRRCEIVRFGLNKGLAAGLNAGCSIAAGYRPDYVLLSDQDSLPAQDMVEHLLKGFELRDSDALPVAAVGPSYRDVHTGIAYPFQVKRKNRIFYSHTKPASGDGFIEVLTLITSGTLVSCGALFEVGLMREDLFIDQIDIEWRLRAGDSGFTLLGCPHASMYQRMGVGSLRVWYFGWRNESSYGATRLYYRFRNYIALLREREVPMHWKVRAGWYHLGLCYTHIFFSKNRVRSAKAIFFGFADGLMGEMGEAKRVLGDAQ